MFKKIISTFKGDEQYTETIYVIAIYREELGHWCPCDELENIDDAKIVLEERKRKFKEFEFAIFKYDETESVKRIIE